MCTPKLRQYRSDLEYHLLGVSMLEPYRRLARQPQLAENSILLSRPTTPFDGLYTALRRREYYPAMIAFVACLSKILPVSLSRIPFNILQIQTWNAHLAYSGLTIGILSLMILVHLGSLFVRYPPMPADPSVLLGAMYYVCDSSSLGDFDGGIGDTTESEGPQDQEDRKKIYL